jgi:trk system potassium uptake protein TrkH
MALDKNSQNRSDERRQLYGAPGGAEPSQDLRTAGGDGVAPLRFAAAMNLVMVANAIAATATLVLQYGYRLIPSEISPNGLLLSQGIVLAIFTFDRIVRLLSPGGDRRLARDWIDIVAVLATAAGVAMSGPGAMAAGVLYIALWHGYVGAAHCVRWAQQRIEARPACAAWILPAGLFAIIVIGSGLLKLPTATVEDKQPFWYHHAVYTSVGATCLTCLSVRNIGSDFTLFGQFVIFLLMQVGGLVMLTLGGLLALFTARRLLPCLRRSAPATAPASMAGRGSSRPSGLTTNGPPPTLHEDIVSTARFAFWATVIIELVGAAMMYPMFAASRPPDADYGPAMTAWCSLFHSASAFCNAGFSLYDNNLREGVNGGPDVVELRRHWQIFGILVPLILLGGLGMPFLQDCRMYGKDCMKRLVYSLRHMPETSGNWFARLVRAWRSQGSGAQFSMHSNLALTLAATLIVAGAGVLLLIEPTGEDPDHKKNSFGSPIALNTARSSGDWEGMTLRQRIPGAVFLAVSSRTAGFDTFDPAELSSAGKLWICALMTIGGTAGGTAGGFKAITLAILLAMVWSLVRGRPNPRLSEVELGPRLLQKAGALVLVYMAMLGLVAMLLAATMPDAPFIDLLFTACSACSNTGLSTMAAANLSEPAKAITFTAILIARVLPLAMMFWLLKNEPARPTPNSTAGPEDMGQELLLG